VSAGDEPRGHAELVRGLWRARRRGRLSHALLFVGPPGVGKYRAARWFARGLYCEALEAATDPREPCGVCGPCRRFLAGSHPDVLAVDPRERELEELPVAAISPRRGDDKWSGPTVTEFLALRAAEGGARVVLLREFERANEEAQNALLKTLEEPGESSVLVLETSRPDLLLDTVRSRCVPVRFEPLGEEDARAVLAEAGRGALDPALLRWAEGSPGRALLLERQGVADQRRVLEEALRGRLDPVEAGGRVAELEGEFEGRTPTARARERARVVLDLALAVLADGVRHASGVPAEGLVHGDLAALAAGRAASWSAALERLLVLRGDVELNLAPESLYDRAFLALPRPPEAARPRP
jgi:DNA polymerase-3 subunit delta'